MRKMPINAVLLARIHSRLCRVMLQGFLVLFQWLQLTYGDSVRHARNMMSDSETRMRLTYTTSVRVRRGRARYLFTRGPRRASKPPAAARMRRDEIAGFVRQLEQRVRDVELLGRAAEAALSCDGHEIAQMSKLHLYTSRVSK